MTFSLILGTFLVIARLLYRGRDLGGLGDGPKKFEVGKAHASVPPIFGEVVLSDVCESTNTLKKVILF